MATSVEQTQNEFQSKNMKLARHIVWNTFTNRYINPKNKNLKTRFQLRLELGKVSILYPNSTKLVHKQCSGLKKFL